MSFIFRPGQPLILDDDPSNFQSEIENYNVYGDVSDNNPPDDDFVPNPRLNYEKNMPKDIYEDLMDQNALIICDQDPGIPLPSETKRISIDLQSVPSQKLAMPLIAAFNKVYPHPRNQFNFLPLPVQLAFVSMITLASILPTLEYFAQISLSDPTSIYCTLIDSFKSELIDFNILPDNKINFS